MKNYIRQTPRKIDLPKTRNKQIFDIDKIKKVDQLQFEDIISGIYMRAIYTHWIDNKPMFLMETKIDNIWKCDDVYIQGFSSVRGIINKYDLKQIKLTLK
jgi:hypothetical protein